MILVFGQTGQVARELQRLAPGARCLGRDQADLSDPAACAVAIRAARPRAVINAAAWTAVDRAEAEEPAAHVINAEAPGAMARACAELGVPMVQLSTDYVFDGSPGPRRPGDPAAPLNAYGRTKLAGEVAVRASGAPHVILRTSWVFSAHGTNFVKTMLRLGAARDEIAVVADQIGGPTPAAALADACLTLAEALIRDPGKSGTHHFAGTPAVSWADFARAIMAGAGLPCRVRDIPGAEYPTPARRPADSRLDCSQLATEFGITQPDWQTHLAAVIAQLKEA